MAAISLIIDLFFDSFCELSTTYRGPTPRRTSNGPMSIRALSKDLGRDYKNVHTDVRCLEIIGLIGRTKNDRIKVPWDVVEAHLLLAA